MKAGKSFHLIAQGMTVAPLLAKLAAHPELWTRGPRETYEGSAHAQSESILLRWVTPPDHHAPQPAAGGGNELQAHLDCCESYDQPAAAVLMPEAGTLVMDVLERLGAVGDLGHVMLTRIQPGGWVKRHIDEGVYADLHDRFHVCLAGGAGNTFICGHEVLQPAPGDLFWFNHKRPHLVDVQSTDPTRIHLIVDVMAPHFTELRGTTYQRELGANLREELEDLLRLHWHEVAHYPDIALDPDWGAYATLEAAGQVRVYTVRERGVLVGYVAFFVRANLHYKGSLQAWQDVLFVHPDHRAGLAGIRLIRYAEARLRAEGVQVVYHHAKLTNRVGELLQRLGYEEIDRILGKRLDREEGKG